MKKIVWGFIRRGMIASGFGPIVLAICYLIMQRVAEVESLHTDQVCIGILSLSALAFVAGGMNVLYQIDRLPLMPAILIHGTVLYIAYLVTYLINDWLNRGMIPILVFTGIFVVGYLAIWAIIYVIIRRSTRKLNEQLKQKQQDGVAM